MPVQPIRATEAVISEARDVEPDNAEDGDFWSIHRTGVEWGVSDKTVWREVERGALGVVRIGPSGRTVRTTRASRKAYLDGRRG